MAALPPGIDLSQVPLAANPSGAPPNFVDPPELITAVQAVGITLGITALTLVILRFIIYNRTSRPVGLDDIFVVLAFVFAAGYTGISASLGGITRHAWDTPLSFLDAVYLKKLFVTSLFYGPMLFFGKASILILYYRAFKPIKWLRIGVYITLPFLFGTYWVTVPLCFTYCMPHNGKAWDLVVLANCNHLATPGLVQAGVNIAVDIAIFVLPIPIVAKLQMPLGKKIALCGVFATGLLALVASALTVFYRVEIIRGPDSSWAGAQTYILIQTEIYASISVACMPSLAKMWNLNMAGSRFFRSMQSLLSIVKGSSSKRPGDSNDFDNSMSALRRDGYDEIDSYTYPNGIAKGNGIRKTTSIELSVVTAQRG